MLLSATCLDEWIKDFDSFRVEFLRFSLEVSKACGYSFDFDQNQLQMTHSFWVSECSTWAGGDAKIIEISHLKIVSCLCVSLSKFKWIKDIFEYDLGLRESEFAGSPDERLETRRDINGAREVFFAYQFSIQVLNWFEIARDDRLQSFEFRMTPGLEHDILHYLSTDDRQIYGIFLMFKALYARDFKPFLKADESGD